MLALNDRPSVNTTFHKPDTYAALLSYLAQTLILCLGKAFLLRIKQGFNGKGRHLCYQKSDTEPNKYDEMQQRVPFVLSGLDGA